MTGVEPQSWHHGLVARWWALFRRGGPEVAYFRRFVEAGQPALDVACGAGRLLVPYVEAGLDVDGCDASADMVALCAEAAGAVGATPGLYRQVIHKLDLPRRYRTIYVCGGLGLGTTREQDRTGLRRLFEHLEPGGRLVIDNEVPYADPAGWSRWPPGTRDHLPEPEQPPGERQRGPDGDDYALSTRMLALDPLAQQEAWEISIRRWHDGELVGQERYRLTTNLYFCSELVMMLEGAGFPEVEVLGAYNGLPPTADDRFLVYTATRPGR